MRSLWNREFSPKASLSPTKSLPETPKWTRPSRKPASGSPKEETCNSSDSTKVASSAVSRRTWPKSAPSRPSASPVSEQALEEADLLGQLAESKGEEPMPWQIPLFTKFDFSDQRYRPSADAPPRPPRGPKAVPGPPQALENRRLKRGAGLPACAICGRRASK